MPTLKLASDCGVRVNNFRDPSEAAADLLSQHWDGEIPVSVTEIAQRAGVTLIKRHIEHGTWSWCSIYRKGRDRDASPVIEYNTAEESNRRRFAVAHALGHFVLGHEAPPQDFRDSFSTATKAPIEREANMFAISLLIPTDVLTSMVQAGRATSIESLAQIFAVSPVAIAARLRSIPELESSLILESDRSRSRVGLANGSPSLVVSLWKSIRRGLARCTFRGPLDRRRLPSASTSAR